jgi:hypothetical protein
MLWNQRLHDAVLAVHNCVVAGLLRQHLQGLPGKHTPRVALQDRVMTH